MTRQVPNFIRAFALEDISIRSGGDGRTVEAYAAVFNVDTEIHDHDGNYTERIDPAAFNKAINDAAPAGSRANWSTKVMFNHGRDMYGRPSDRFAMPIGTPQEIRADGRGLLTITQYARTSSADEALELIRAGAITAQSFQGSFLRSDKATPRGGFRADKSGALESVTRQEISLKEYGPAIFAAYPDAAIVGVRQELLDAIDAIDGSELTPTERATLALRLSALTLTGPGAADTSDTEAVTAEPLTHSTRQRMNSIRRQLRERGIL